MWTAEEETEDVGADEDPKGVAGGASREEEAELENKDLNMLRKEEAEVKDAVGSSRGEETPMASANCSLAFRNRSSSILERVETIST